jgi:DNA replication licensing factor MCM7
VERMNYPDYANDEGELCCVVLCCVVLCCVVVHCMPLFSPKRRDVRCADDEAQNCVSRTVPYRRISWQCIASHSFLTRLVAIITLFFVICYLCQVVFAKFIQEHTISTIIPDRLDNDDDDDVMLEPRAGPHSVQRIPCYPPVLQRIKDRDFYTETGNYTFVVEVPLDELVQWDAIRGEDLAIKVEKNTTRYQELFCAAFDTALAGMESHGGADADADADAGGNDDQNNHNRPIRDTVDILHEQRLAQQRVRDAARDNNPAANNDIHNHYAGGGNLNEENNNAGTDPNNPNLPGGATEEFPPVLMRRYELRILPRGRKGSLPPFAHQQHANDANDGRPLETDTLAGISLRNVRSRSMGRLVTVRGMIVRASDVKPFCVVATYSCDSCGAEVYQVVQNKREFMPQRFCPSGDCQKAKNKGQTLHLQTRGSKFVKFQELKLQELPSQVPMGHVPRSMSVYCRGELTRLASPGDVVTVDGVFLPQRLAESGYRAMVAGLISTTYLEAQNVVVHKKSYDESLLDSLSEEESVKLDAEIMEVATGEDPIGRLSQSIAPEIFGHEDIKRSLLLQLVGGCTRQLPDGMRIRGDINICLMGDPGVAKSQLLKHVASVAPRGVYTTGKGSSGVGLTAAVTKDMATGEMALEGGALVLADRGICCIDEFDKMDESDRTAIHEVMEQQTVSIAKAGIVATLNARASVLAAANPLYGRYNRTKSLSENINLPNSLLSRVDLLYLILDIADGVHDIALARHVTFVHQNEGLEQATDASTEETDAEATTGTDGNAATTKAAVLAPRVLREYIARSRKHNPVMPPEVAPYVVEAYVSLRMQDRPGARNKKESDQTVMTARQLLSMLRLSQSLARLRFSDFVAREDVDEAIRLTHMSKASLLDNDDAGGSGKGRKRGEDVMSRVFNIIRDYASVSGSKEVQLKLCEAMVLRKGFTAQQLKSCLEEYEALQVIQVNSSRTHVYFIDGV